MDLFPPDPHQNLLPCDGIVRYLGAVFDPAEAEQHFATLQREVLWKNDEVTMFGKRLVTARKVAWYGDAGYAYTYSGTTKHALEWPAFLLPLKQWAETKAGMSFNSCLLNLYHDGNEGMSWHSDDEACLGPSPTIASLSFGAKRKFRFKHRRLPLTVSLDLEPGSLLLMEGATQHHWLHCVPKTRTVQEPRINLTFRRFV